MLKIIEAIPHALGADLSSVADMRAIADEILRDGTVYCFKRCLLSEPIDVLRQALFDHYRTVPAVKTDYDNPQLMNSNYHAVEQGVSTYQKTLHFYHAYLFNDMAKLPATLYPVRDVFHSLAVLHNALTGEKRGLMQEYAGGSFRPQIFQYPVGGGMFAAHVHALQPQKIGVILGFSKRGRDFQNGGSGFELPNGAILDTGREHDIGDILLFRYDLKHWVTPCDIASSVDLNKSHGRWTAVLPIY